MTKPTKVMIVDDSASVRRLLVDMLAQERGIELLGTAQDPLIAAKKMRRNLPDVLILDIEMPRMDGLTFLKKIMSQHPIPTIICSSLAVPGSQAELQALALGAVGVIEKPRVDTRKHLEESRIQLIDTIYSAANANITKLRHENWLLEPKLSADVILEGGAHNVGSARRLKRLWPSVFLQVARKPWRKYLRLYHLMPLAW